MMEVENLNIQKLTLNDPNLTDEELYLKVKELENEINLLDIKEDFIREEQKNLKKELVRAKEEIKKIQAVPLVIGQFVEMIDINHAMISSTSGSNMYVRVLSILDREKLKPNCSVALHRYSNSVVDILPSEADSSIQMMQVNYYSHLIFLFWEKNFYCFR